jgi:3-oxoadipate enol-lactonase
MLNYEVSGAGSPVVLLHGGALDSRAWDGQFAPFAEHHTVIRYDLRGHGRSSTPTEPFAHCDDLRDLLDTLGIPRASLVGLSLGSRTSIDFALSYPDRVNRLVLASPGIGGMTFRDPFILDQLDRHAEARAAHDVDGALECVVRMWVDGPHRTPDRTDPAIRKFCHDLIADTVARHAGAGQRLMTDLDAINRVDELRAPILTLVGDLDSSDIHAVADLLGGHKEISAGVGHNLNLERPEEFNRRVLDFLSRPW